MRSLTSSVDIFGPSLANAPMMSMSFRSSFFIGVTLLISEYYNTIKLRFEAN